MTTDSHDHDHHAVAEDLPSVAELVQHKVDDSDDVTLLRQWLRWWATNGAPVDMPNGLHALTALHLSRVDGKPTS